MKLLRLLDVDTETTGRLQFTLNEALHLDTKSQVCLQSCTLDLVPQIIEITDLNHTINFSTEALNTAAMVATLTNGSYTADQLVVELQNALNRALDATAGVIVPGPTVGFQFKTSILNGVITISFNQCDPSTFPTRQTTGGTDAAGLVTKTVGTAGYACYSVEQIPFIQGCGYTLAQPGTPAVTDGVNRMISLATTSIPASGSYTAMAFSILVDGTGGNYFTSSGGAVPVDSTILALPTDLFGFSLSEGLLSMGYYRNGAFNGIGAGAPINFSQPYYCVASIEGAINSTMQLGGFTAGPTNRFHCYDPYALPNTTSVTTIAQMHFKNVLSQPAANTLGFNPVLYQSPTAATYGDFTGASSIYTTKERLCLAVLLESLPTMDSFDSLSHGRRPILATLSAYDIHDGTKIEYEPANLVWLDINNPMPMDISNFQIRVVDVTDTAMEVGNGCVFTLLFR